MKILKKYWKKAKYAYVASCIAVILSQPTNPFICDRLWRKLNIWSDWISQQRFLWVSKARKSIIPISLKGTTIQRSHFRNYILLLSLSHHFAILVLFLSRMLKHETNKRLNHYVKQKMLPWMKKIVTSLI
jgi:hypothetical protein